MKRAAIKRPNNERITDYTRQENADYWQLVGDLMADYPEFTFTWSHDTSRYLIQNGGK